MYFAADVYFKMITAIILHDANLSCVSTVPNFNNQHFCIGLGVPLCL